MSDRGPVESDAIRLVSGHNNEGEIEDSSHNSDNTTGNTILELSSLGAPRSGVSNIALRGHEGPYSAFGDIDDDDLLRLVGQHGPSLINQKSDSGLTLIHRLVSDGRFESASRLIEYAENSGISVDLIHNEGDLLGDMLTRGTPAGVRFVLEKLISQISTVEETARILKSNFGRLLDKCPDLMQDYLIHNKFSFEEGSFLAPASLFENKEDRPLFYTTDDVPKWTTLNSNEIASIWETKTSEVKKALRQKDTYMVEAVSKFVCIEDFPSNRLSYFSPKFNVLNLLNKTNLSVEVYKSESIFSLVQSKWLNCRSAFLIGISLQIFSAIVLLSYAIFIDVADIFYLDDIDETDLAVIVVFSLCSGLIQSSVGMYFLIYRDFVRGMIAFSPLVASLYIYVPEYSDTVLLILLALITFILWTMVLSSLRPFKHVGPLVSMFIRIFIDTVPFVLVGLTVLTSFGMVLTTISRQKDRVTSETVMSLIVPVDEQNICNREDEDGLQWWTTLSDCVFDKQCCNETPNMTSYMITSFEKDDMTLRKVFASLFYAMITGLESEGLMRCGNSDACLTPIIFGAFIFIGHVLLLTLLVSVLGDSYDRETHNRISNIMKSRSDVSNHYGSNRLKGLNLILCMCSPLLFLVCKRKSPGDALWKKKYFHYLVPREEPKNEELNWNGRLHYLETTHKASLRDHEKKVKAAIKQTKGELTEKINSSTTQFREIVEASNLQHSQDIRELRERVDVLSSQMERLLEVLERSTGRV